MDNEGCTAEPRGRSWLSAVLLVVAAASVALSVSLASFLIPAARRSASNTRDVQSQISKVQYLISGQANDERGFLLSGNPIFLAEFTDKQRQVEVQLALTMRNAPLTVRQRMVVGVEPYRSFVSDHAVVVALFNSGDRDGAVALAMGRGRDSRKSAEAFFSIAADEVVSDANNAAAGEAVLTNMASVALIVLGVGLVFVAGVTTRRLKQQQDGALALRDSERHFRTLVHHAPMAVCAVDLEGVVLSWNPAASTIFGWTEAEAVGRMLPFVSTERRGEFAHLRAEVIAGRSLNELEITRSRRDGSAVEVSMSTAPVLDDAGNVVGIIGIVSDITERKLAEIELGKHRQNDQQLASIVKASADAILSISSLGIVTSWNNGAASMFGHQAADVVGAPFNILTRDQDRAMHNHHIKQALGGRSIISEELIGVRRSGVEFPAAITVSPILDTSNSVVGLSAVVRDITTQKDLESTLVHRALHDHLTGLPNRALFLDRLALALARLEQHGGVVAVVFIDIDQFKVVNDSLGHAEGDLLLTMIAARLGATVRRGDTVARFGGDEFAVLCEGLHDEAEAIAAAERVQHIGTMPFVLNGRDHQVTLSAGIAITSSADASATDLLRDADAAMYQAKDEGRSCSVVFTQSMRTRALRRLHVETSLRRAITHGELRLVYQPIVNLRTGRTDGVEALVRWQHPTEGLLTPDDFIPIAEETGLIVALGEWVLGEACRQVHAWHAHPELAHLTVSVNLSGRQIAQTDVVTAVSNILANTNMAPSHLVLEITESVLMRDMTHSITVLQNLKSLGVGLSIDDFGTGYSSLSYLKTFPVDILKIDKSFVDGLGVRTDDSSIVEAIIKLAHSLHLTTVAEGTETALQVRTLTDLECDKAQGYHYSRPLPADELTRLLLRPVHSLATR